MIYDFILPFDKRISSSYVFVLYDLGESLELSRLMSRQATCGHRYGRIPPLDTNKVRTPYHSSKICYFLYILRNKDKLMNCCGKSIGRVEQSTGTRKGVQCKSEGHRGWLETGNGGDTLLVMKVVSIRPCY